MNKEIFKFLKEYESDPLTIDRLIVSAFVRCNKIIFFKNELLKKYIVTENSQFEYNKLNEFLILLGKYNIINISFETLIELFEFVVSPSDKEVNGAVYTPYYIRKYIISNIFESFKKRGEEIKDITIADVACGCGSFLFDIAKLLKALTGQTYDSIFRKNIFGLDIKKYSIDRSKIILILLAISEGEDLDTYSFNLFTGNALSFDWENDTPAGINGGFHSIVGNPPYVGSSKIDLDSKALLKNWSVSKTGKSDLYIPFFQIGLNHLRQRGILGYITVNSFFKSLNGRALRNYFSSNEFAIKIIDFGSEQVFHGRSTYTCICLIEKKVSDKILYLESCSSKILETKDKDFVNIKYSNLDDKNGWILREKKALQNITTIQSKGQALEKLFEIRNGFATLQNEIYVFKIDYEGDFFYHFTKNKTHFKVEKGICRKAIKPNILKNESDIKKYEEMLIFPYHISSTEDNLTKKKVELNIIDEITFRQSYPFAFKYLKQFIGLLNLRDKGNRTYEKWYSFGRNQALTLSGLKLLFPYIADKPHFIYTDDTELLFYNGYAILSENERDLLVLKKILSSTVFWYYVKHVSKPYESKYFSLAKNHIKLFKIYPFTEEEKEFLLQAPQVVADTFIEKAYNVQL